MRHKGNTNEHKPSQDRDIMRTYRRILSIYGGIIRVADIYRLVAFAPATRFYVSEQQALRVCTRFSEQALSRMRGQRAAMYRVIYSRVLNLRRLNPAITIRQAVDIIVRQPAPRMFLSPRQISAIIKKEKSRRPPLIPLKTL